jgi:hypothetical protein
MKHICGNPDRDACEMCVRGEIADALRKRADELLPNYHDIRFAQKELQRAADLIEKGELP